MFNFVIHLDFKFLRNATDERFV